MTGSFSFLASSFHPPSVGSAAAAGRYPAWVLLDRKAYFADVENATTATATSRTGHTVKVTFCLADPPSLSHFCVHGPTEHFDVEPQVVSSEKHLVLLLFAFTGGDIFEYFIYDAGRGNHRSLRLIPATPPGTRNTKYVSMVVRDDGEFLLADLFGTSTTANYDLTIFSSRTNRWITRTLQVQAPAEQLRVDDLFMVSHKAISLGGGMVGWVDLWRAVIVCDILAEDPFIYLIPLPKPEFNLARTGDPKPIRDVTGYSNGVIRFVEMECYFRREIVTVYQPPDNRFKMTKDLDTLDKMHDIDMLLLPHEDFPERPTEKIKYIPDGWKIRTCHRSISWDHWRRGHGVHVDDICGNSRKHSVLLPQLFNVFGKLTLRNLAWMYPILSPTGDDVVYLMSKVEIAAKDAWMVGVDLGTKMVKVLEQYSAARARYFKLDCVTCAFSEFLNTAPRCAEEAEFASNEPQNCLLHDHRSSGNSGCAYHQHQPPLLPNSPQPLPLNLSSSGPGNNMGTLILQAAKAKTVERNDQTGIFVGEKTKAAKRKALETAPYTKEFTKKTGSILQQVTETVKGAVANTLGMGGGDNAATGNVTGDH